MHNLFDVSSYGEVQMKQITTPGKGDSLPGGFVSKTAGADASVSLVQMDDSIAAHDLKGPKGK